MPESIGVKNDLKSRSKRYNIKLKHKRMSEQNRDKKPMKKKSVSGSLQAAAAARHNQEQDHENSKNSESASKRAGGAEPRAK